MRWPVGHCLVCVLVEKNFRRNHWRGMGSNWNIMSSRGSSVYLQRDIYGKRLACFPRGVTTFAPLHCLRRGSRWCWPDALVVRIGTEHPTDSVNDEELRLSANRPAAAADTNADSAAKSRESKERRGTEETEEKVGSFPRKESFLLRRTSRRGSTEWGLTPHPGPYFRH